MSAARTDVFNGDMRRGRYVRWVQKPDNSALLRLLARLDRHALDDGAYGP